MVIKCVKCQTKFRLDDSRITEKGVKVRCTKCKHVFTVQKEVSEDAFEPESEGASYAAPPLEKQYISAASVTSAPDAGVAPDSVEESFPRSDSAESVPFEASHFDTSAISFETDDFQPAEGKIELPADQVPAGSGDVDFSGFDFGDNEDESEFGSPAEFARGSFTDATAATLPIAEQKMAPKGLDFSDDDMFGAVVESSSEVSSDTFTFDFEGDSFAESMDMSGQDSSGKGGSLFSLDAPGDAPFNLGEIDFGDELTSVAVQQVNPEDLKPAQEILFAPLAEAGLKTSDDAVASSFLESGYQQNELPPLSIASRRKQGPLSGAVIAVVALLAVSLLGYFGYIGYSSFTTTKESGSQESGTISVRGVKAVFIDNDTVGELLVISGEAVNEYPKPRAALQVKVTVYDAAGQSVATKVAYGGNPLTEEQLESMPLDKIEVAMANQFGDSLANMEVAPGKSIPFVVVLANLPGGAMDFAVQSAGSTVATGKQ